MRPIGLPRPQPSESFVHLLNVVLVAATQKPSKNRPTTVLKTVLKTVRKPRRIHKNRTFSKIKTFVNLFSFKKKTTVFRNSAKLPYGF